MKKVASRRLVIDASVARAAGGIDAFYPSSKICRDLLLAVRRVCHRMVVTTQILEEWERHESSFTREWRTTMVSLRKVMVVEEDDAGAIWARLETCYTDPGIVALVRKDFCLVQAALASDRVVVALDDRVRDQLSFATREVPELADIVWVNPAASDGEALEWVERGAKSEPKRRLRNHQPAGHDRAPRHRSRQR